VELAKHDFYRHIFPQITKFFSFFSNSKSRNDLLDKIYTIIESNINIKNDIKRLCKGKEVYKLLKDSIDENQNILLILDENKPELPEIFDTYKEWGSKVKLEIIKKFMNNTNTVYSMDPEFDELEFYVNENIEKEGTAADSEYQENDHLNRTKDTTREIYTKLKEELLSINPSLIFNPQRYYISVKNNKNIIFIKIRQKKIRLIIMLEPAIIKEKISKNRVKDLSQSVQNFYNGPCAAVDVDNIDNLNEVIELIKLLIGYKG
jgi:predicted transport protein